MLLRRLPSEPPSPDPAGDSPAPLRSKLRSLLWPLGLLTAGLVGIILVLLVFAAREQDQLALEASEHLARSALQNEINEIKSEARDYATWDATLDNLVLTLNESWADENIGTWAHDGLEMDATLVVDGQDRARYAMIAGERLGDEALTRITDGLAPLVGAARAAPPSDLGIALSGHLVLDGQIAIAAASPIVRTDGTVATKPDGASVLVYIRTLDAAALKEMEENYLLPDLRIVAGDALPQVGPIALTTISGTVLGRLAWTAEQPGLFMLQPLMVPGAIAGTIGLFLLWVVIRRASRTMRELEASHTALQEQATELAAARDRAELQTKTEVELRCKAVDASRAKSEFLALVSHELRTPLNAILGFSETIATQAFGSGATERYREYAADIHESGSHLLSIINDILDLTKVEAGRYELHEEEVDLDGLLRRCVALLRERAGEKGLVLACQNSDIRLRADARALKQIVINLLSNAIKFTGQGGRVELRAAAGPQGPEIAVIDSGIGMSPDDLSRALQPFGQAASALTRSVEGSGLGLNVTQALTRLHGGHLAIQSTPGRGTTVVVHLPGSRLISPAPRVPSGAAA